MGLFVREIYEIQWVRKWYVASRLCTFRFLKKQKYTVRKLDIFIFTQCNPVISFVCVDEFGQHCLDQPEKYCTCNKMYRDQSVLTSNKFQNESCCKDLPSSAYPDFYKWWKYAAFRGQKPSKFQSPNRRMTFTWNEGQSISATTFILNNTRPLALSKTVC